VSLTQATEIIVAIVLVTLIALDHNRLSVYQLYQCNYMLAPVTRREPSVTDQLYLAGIFCKSYSHKKEKAKCVSVIEKRFSAHVYM
jgi:hypothetical protein